MKLLTFLFILISIQNFCFSQKKKLPQYKKQNRDQISALTKGEFDKVEDYFRKYLQKNPGDLESHYGIVLALSGQGKIDEAVAQVELAMKDGIDFNRFVAGPRNLLKGLYSSESFKKLAAKHTRLVIHGPLVGHTTDVESSVWVRTDRPRKITVEVSEKADFSEMTATGSGSSTAEDDFTCVVKISGLKASTEYFYRLSADSKEQVFDYKLHFKTFPSGKKADKFSIAFGGGAGYTPIYEHMWKTIEKHDPLALLLMGDNVYIDTPEIPETQKYCYYRRQSVPYYRSLTAGTPVFAVYDDHDFGANDCYGTNSKDSPVWKRPVLKIFKQNWANPSYGGGKENPGCWFKFNIGDVEFFMLDTRYYREKQKLKKPGKTMLGAFQKAWLKKEMLASKATFKVICSSVPMCRCAKPGPAGLDTWDGYDEEREEIFDFLADNDVKGVFILSADRHRSDAWKIKRKKGYPLYEVMSSRLTNIHTHKVMPKSLFGYNETCSFGKLTFDFTKDDPQVLYEIFCIDNKKRGELLIKLSQLQK